MRLSSPQSLFKQSSNCPKFKSQLFVCKTSSRAMNRQLSYDTRSHVRRTYLRRDKEILLCVKVTQLHAKSQQPARLQPRFHRVLKTSMNEADLVLKAPPQPHHLTSNPCNTQTLSDKKAARVSIEETRATKVRAVLARMSAKILPYFFDHLSIEWHRPLAPVKTAQVLSPVGKANACWQWLTRSWKG